VSKAKHAAADQQQEAYGILLGNTSILSSNKININIFQEY
jgi:hypothetical protein